MKISARDCLKDKGTFHKETRQCKISPNLFSSLKMSDTLDSASERVILDTSLNLLSKIIDLNKQFHLTLLGISFTDFVAVTKHGIQAFCVKPNTNKEEKPQSSKRKADSESEDTTQPSKLPSGWDEDVFMSLPIELQQELLSSSQQTSQILSTPSSHAPNKKSKNSSNSILNYFGKK